MLKEEKSFSLAARNRMLQPDRNRGQQRAATPYMGPTKYLPVQCIRLLNIATGMSTHTLMPLV